MTRAGPAVTAASPSAAASSGGVLVLTAEEVAGLLDPAAAVEAVEALFAAEAAGRVRVPARLTVETGQGWFRVMPGVLQDGEVPLAGAKVMALAQGTGLTYLLLLYDAGTGRLLALMDASTLTQRRTGAVTAAFVRFAFPTGVGRLGLFGSGFEAQGQFEAIAQAVAVEAAVVYSPRAERRERFAREMSERLGVAVGAVGDPQAVAAASLVVLATRAPRPVVEGAWFAPGTVIVSIGATRPDLREVDETTVRRAGRVLVDHRDQALQESGDVRAALAAGIIGEADVVAVGRVLAGEVPLRTGELVLFKPSGTAAQDLAVARVVYARARARGVGRTVDGFLTVKPR